MARNGLVSLRHRLPGPRGPALGALLQRFSDAVTGVDHDAMVFYEPFVLFNFGQSDTSLPRIGPSGALAPHSYAVDPSGEDAVVDHTVAAASRSGQPAIIGEFGATTDTATIDRLTAGFDRGMLPWIFWAYNEELVRDLGSPPEGDNLRTSVVDAITRPYPDATAGTPVSLSFDSASRRLHYTFSTTGPDGPQRPAGVSSIVLPASVYPGGYSVEVSGARVVSTGCTDRLAIRNRVGAQEVEITVTPGGPCP